MIFSKFFFLTNYKMSAPASDVPVPVAEPVVAPKKTHALTGRKPSDKQMEALRKGMEGLKKRREDIAKAKEEGTYNPEDFRAKPKIVKVAAYVPVSPPPPPKRETVFVPRKKYERKLATAEEIIELKNVVAELKAGVSAPREVEKIVEKPVEVVREVVKERVVTGKDMLDRIFFSK